VPAAVVGFASLGKDDECVTLFLSYRHMLPKIVSMDC
jgi:hypothetical protein